MYDFMEYCLRRYYRASGWNEDNQYSHLCATSRALLDFQAPTGLSLRLSKLPSSVFKTTTTMNALPILEGSVGYLFTSRALMIDDSASVRFRHLVDRFRIICLDHSIREADQWTEFDTDGKRRKDYLLCGRMNLANARLEALYSRRVSKHRQYVLSGISDPASRSASHMSAQFQYDKGKYCAEVSFTTDDGLIGVRGLYNFGKDFDDSYEDMQKEGGRRRRESGIVEEEEETTLLTNLDSGSIELEQESAEDSSTAARQSATLEMKSSDDLRRERKGYLGEETSEEESMPSERIRGYWSTGAEVYYSATEKLGGLSMGLRYRTLPPLAPFSTSEDKDASTQEESTGVIPRYPTSTAPEHHQNYIPITITQTLNPIMGHVSSSYAAQVHPDLGLCSRFDFNLYSYDSELTAGVEWWIRKRKGSNSSSTSNEQTTSDPFPKTIGVPDLAETGSLTSSSSSESASTQPIVGVIKARLGVQSGLAIMWEGRFNKLLFSLGFVGHVISPHAQAPIVKSVGLEIQYFS
ncbi:Mitochondrial distribution and morphology protein 10 [Mortierella sp. GBA35]|nr:Mitochondrial distribution and morphology protein 10 [Mortierella sp. AD031]KAF9090837.1 Mitochondrial distribution and morphology protein 10 [Mortierella sp. GBA35]KAG0219376.1 Mitochondrial distribution and morphology protein 10 [Mortierella sp. NVP41]